MLGPGNDIGDKGAEHLAEALAKNKTLLNLNFRCLFVSKFHPCERYEMTYVLL